jgi:hypothetical protein
MTYRMQKLFWLMVVAGSLFPAAAVAGPWLPEPGEGYVKAAGNHFESTGTRDVSGDSIEPDFDYSHNALRLYADFGLAEHLGISASVPFVRSQNAERGSPTVYKKSGFGDLDLAAQTGTTIEQLAISAVLEGRIPLYSETISADAPTPNSIGEFRTRYTPALGDGSYDVTAKLELGYSLYPFPGWISASVGPKVRFQGFGDGFEYAAGGGAFVFPERLALKARISGVERFTDDNERPTKRYVQLSGGLLAPVTEKISLEVTGGYIPTGAFVSEGWSVTAGLSFDGQIF